MPEDIPNRMSENMPDKISENMLYRMPEDLLIAKYIDVRLGIIRNKTILIFLGIFSANIYLYKSICLYRYY